MTAEIDRSSESPAEPETGQGPLGRWRFINNPFGKWGVGFAVLVVLVAFWGLARKSLVIGVVSDAPLVLAAIGFALLYRLTGLINVAYSETITMGAYLGMWVNTTFGLNFYVTLIPAATAAAGGVPAYNGPGSGAGGGLQRRVGAAGIG